MKKLTELQIVVMKALRAANNGGENSLSIQDITEMTGINGSNLGSPLRSLFYRSYVGRGSFEDGGKFYYLADDGIEYCESYMKPKEEQIIFRCSNCSKDTEKPKSSISENAYPTIQCPECQAPANLLDKNGIVVPEVHIEPKEKPPLGLRPRKIADRMRGEEIVQAMFRYFDAKKVVPGEWVDELQDILNKP